MSLKFQAELPSKVPASLFVYRLAPVQASPRAMTRAAQRLGLTGKAADFSLSDDWTTYHEGRYYVSVHHQSGALRYRHRDKYGIETDRAFGLAPRDATRLALAFLKRTAIVPLKDAIFHRVTHLRSGTGDTQAGRREEKLLDAGVIYRRTVDGIEVNGPGGFAMVNIAPDKDVVGLTSVWRPAGKRLAKVKLIPPERALATIRDLAARLYGDTTVTRASLGYFELGELDRQTYLQPAYCFVYEVRNGDVAHKAIEVIPAGEKTFARLAGGKRFPAPPQARRKVPARGAREDSLSQSFEVTPKRAGARKPAAVR